MQDGCLGQSSDGAVESGPGAGLGHTSGALAEGASAMKPLQGCVSLKKSFPLKVS